MAGNHEVELVGRLDADTGEGPVWDPATSTLVFVDIPKGRVHQLDPIDGRISTVTVDREIGAVVPRRSGGWVAAVRDGIAVLDIDTGELELVCPIEADRPGNRMNDAACDPAGRLWAGTMAFDITPGAGSLYRIDSSLDVEVVVTGVTISNGLGWSPDATTMYYVDSPTEFVDAFDFAVGSGRISGRRHLVDLRGEPGAPDGMTVDDEGHLWVAMWGGAAVLRCRPDGAIVDRVELPVGQVTSCAFGGPEGDELYITTAAGGLDEDALAVQPLAGSVFRCRPGVSGPLATSFAG